MTKTALERARRRVETQKTNIALGKQAFFNSTGDVKKPELPKPVDPVEALNISDSAKGFCPYCLTESPLKQFVTLKKDGTASKALAECPACHTGLKLDTAMRDWTEEGKALPAEALAVWVFTSRKTFFAKIDRPHWNAKLKLLKWNMQFWSKYKTLKAFDSPSETQGFTSDGTGKTEAEIDDLYAAYTEATPQ